MSYGEFVSQVHRPITSLKKKVEMENLISKLKHPIKESKKIPSSASYHNLYNQNGQNPWSSMIKNSTNTHISMSQANFKGNQSLRSKSIRSVGAKHRNYSVNTKSLAGDHDHMDENDNMSINIDNHASNIAGRNTLETPNNDLGNPPRKLIVSNKHMRLPRPPKGKKSAKLKSKLNSGKKSKRKLEKSVGHIKNNKNESNREKAQKIKSIADMIESKANQKEMVYITFLTLIGFEFKRRPERRGNHRGERYVYQCHQGQTGTPRG